MRTAVTLAAIVMTASAPSVAAARNPAAPLGLAAARTQASGAQGAGTQGAGSPGTGNAAAGGRQTLPVPGYKFIAAGILLGIAGVVFAITQQDGTPDSN